MRKLIELPEKETTIEVRLVKDVRRCVQSIFKFHDAKFDSKGKFWGYVFSFKSNYLYLILYNGALRHNYVAHEVDHLREFIREYNGLTGLEDLACLSAFISNEIFCFLAENNVKIYYEQRPSPFKAHKIKERFVN